MRWDAIGEILVLRRVERQDRKRSRTMTDSIAASKPGFGWKGVHK